VIIDCRRDPEDAIRAAVGELDSGRVVALATDTVYGLAARAGDNDAIRKIFELKGRPADRRMAVLVAGAEQAAQLVVMGELGGCLGTSFWPGPLTIVAPRLPTVESLAGDATTIGVRCPDDHVVRAIAERAGPLAATSANRHGRPPETNAESVAAAFPTLRLILDGGERKGNASTVVSITGEELAVVRKGPIGETRLRRACGGRAVDRRGTE
jgi:L-threonylcarbamoyladenylate synthase